VTDVRRPEDEPHDRLTRLCGAMTDALDAHPERREGDRCAIFLDDEHRGGIVLHGWESDTEALAALLMHLRAIFRANGKDLEVIGIPNSPEGLS
jgi:hypothetical protein